MSNLNEWQIAVARVYGGGDYAHHKTLEETQEVGDGLYTFIQRELSAEEDCENAGRALLRLDTAIADL